MDEIEEQLVKILSSLTAVEEELNSLGATQEVLNSTAAIRAAVAEITNLMADGVIVDAP